MANLSQELISIVVPAYNSESFIGECLSSIKDQTYHNWECIIVDDRSTDSTFEIALKYADSDNRFRIFKRPNSKIKGANSCRNFGFEKSKGAYIKWFDSDDIMIENHLETVYEKLICSNLDFIVTETRLFGGSIKMPEKKYSYDKSIEITAKNLAINKIGWLTPDLTVRRESIGKLKFNEFLRDGHEYNFNVRLLTDDRKGKIINKITTHYRQHESSISSRHLKNETTYISILLDIKYYTARDIYFESDSSLVKWFLEGYMRLSFDLAIKKVIHHKMLSSLSMICKNFGFFKTSIFLLGITLGYFFNKGYGLVKYARQ